jgi:DNA-directed RNA polymerase specialized sigma24 family protein
VPAEIAGQRPLLERAATGDREAFAQLYDAQVEGVYRYLLAWTGDRQEAADLTGQVFRTALGWLPSAHDRELGAWLIALARDAVIERPGSVRAPGVAGSPRVARLVDFAGAAGAAEGDGPRGAAGDAVAALARLGDPEREVVILRLLLGHSLAHTAHLSDLSQRAVLELQLAACLTVREPTGGAGAGLGPAARTAAPADDFDRRLGRWEVDLAGADPSIADALAAADSFRRAIPGYVVAPTSDLVARLRQDLLTAQTPDATLGPAPGWTRSPALPPDPLGEPPLPAHVASADAEASLIDPVPASAEASLTHPVPANVEANLIDPVPGAAPPGGSVAGPGNGRARLSTGALVGSLFRRPWVATGVATAGIVLVFALQAFGEPGPAPSPTSTTVAVAAGGTSLGTPLTTVLEPSTTTSSTQPALVPATSAPRATTPPAPPTTRPATTAPQTTSAPRPTTTRAPTTTVATTTTAPATTTTLAPAPT